MEKTLELAGPGHNVDEGAVQAGCDREQETVCQAWQPRMRDRELTDKAYRGDAVTCHDEGGPLLNFVGPECEDDGHEHSEDVDWDREKLSVGGGIAELLDDCGYSGCEAVTIVSDATDVNFEILTRRLPRCWPRT
jgi:hypothetical protein